MSKTMLIAAIWLGIMCCAAGTSRAQSIADVTRQLALDYQKLASLKSILAQMYTGYSALQGGYRSVHAVAEGNFNLHEAFLSGLYLVSPAIRKYPRVAGVAGNQLQLLREYKAAFNLYRRKEAFSLAEISYMAGVYNHLVNRSLKNIDDLSMILEDGQLRMNDAERLKAIDRVYAESCSQLSYLRKFNNQAAGLAWQRERLVTGRQTMRFLYGEND